MFVSAGERAADAELPPTRQTCGETEAEGGALANADEGGGRRPEARLTDDAAERREQRLAAARELSHLVQRPAHQLVAWSSP